MIGVEQKTYKGHWAEIVLHASKDGIFKKLLVNSLSVNAEVIEEDLWVSPGDKVKAFEGANDAIGTLVLKFDKEDDLTRAMLNLNSWINIEIE